MLCASGLVCSRSSYAALSFPDLSCSYWNQIQAVLVLIRHLIPFVPCFGTKCVDCQLVTCNAMPKWKAKYFFFIKHCWKSVYFQTFLFFIYVYFSVFFAGFFGLQALTLVVLEGATGCSNLLFANWNSCRHARANPLGMHSIAQNFSISALLSSSAS